MVHHMSNSVIGTQAVAYGSRIRLSCKDFIVFLSLTIDVLLFDTVTFWIVTHTHTIGSSVYQSMAIAVVLHSD